MSKSAQAVRRRKTPLARRLRAFWLPIAMGVTLLISAATFAVRWPGFAPSRVEVVGNTVVSTGRILTRAAVSHDVNVWLQNTREMRARIEEIPDIATAHVYRLPPAAIVIAVTERVPFATLVDGETVVTVDRQLRVLDAPAGDSGLPRFVLHDETALPGRFLTDAKARGLRDVYEAMSAAHVVPLALEYDRYGGLVATVEGGVRVLLGDDADLDKKLPLIDPILVQIVRKQRRVAAVDLRAPRTPVLVLAR